MRWSRRTLKVHGGKVGKDRELPLPPSILAVLELHRGVAGPLAGKDFVSIAENAQRKALYEACPEAGVPRTHWYGLRHTCATLLAERHPIHVVLRWMGHASIKTTEVYLHAGDDALRAAADDDL